MARRRFPVSQKRLTAWIGTADQGDVAVASGASVAISSFTPDTFAMIRPTMVRTRGIFHVQPAGFGADLNFSGAYGLGVVSAEAQAIGATAIPRPFDDDDWGGWMVHGYYAGHLEFQSATSEHQTPFLYQIDSKAMRKIGPNETLIWMVESFEGAVAVTIHARVLAKLS